MKLTIISRYKRYNFQTEKDEVFTNISEIEVEDIRWEENHKLSFIRKGYNQYEYLEDYQEILRLTD